MLVGMNPLMTFTSHIAGRNAVVRLYPDRIEWTRSGRSWVGPLIVALFTVGISLIFYRGTRGQSEMVFTKAITSVVSKPSGFQTSVLVVVSGNTLDFRCSPQEAEEFRGRLLAIAAA